MTADARDPNQDVKDSWRRFLDTYEPLRPDLYRYCRHLTRSPWDAEDMAQDAMARAFVTLACLAEAPHHPRAWLFRVASNLWLNRVRQAREIPAGASMPEPAVSAEPRSTREAAGTLLTQLSAQERAAVVLKDVFDLSLAEIGEALGTTTGAIKTALHRGRAKLGEPHPEEPTPLVPAVLDAFCEAFQARDLGRLTSLLLDTASMEFPGLRIDDGADAIRRGPLRHTLFGCPEGGEATPAATRCEARMHRGEAILLWWWGDDVHAVVRVEIVADRIARLCDYHHCPEVLVEVCRELGVPAKTHGYRPSSRVGDVTP